MKRFLVCCALGTGLLIGGLAPAFVSTPALAYYYHHRYYPYRYHGHYYRYRYHGHYYRYRNHGHYYNHRRLYRHHYRYW